MYESESSSYWFIIRKLAQCYSYIPANISNTYPWLGCNGCSHAWMHLPSHPTSLLAKHLPMSQRPSQKFLAFGHWSAFLFNVFLYTYHPESTCTLSQKDRKIQIIQTCLQFPSQSSTSGIGSTNVTFSCGIKRSKYGWMSLASCGSETSSE